MEKESLDHRIALLIDGPNMAKTDMNQVGKVTEKYGRIMVKEAFLTKDVPKSVIEFYVYAGYQPVINAIKDVDTSLAIRASELICSPRYDNLSLIAIASQDVDYISIFQKSRSYDKRVLIIGSENGHEMSQALKRNADYFEVVKVR